MKTISLAISAAIVGVAIIAVQPRITAGPGTASAAVPTAAIRVHHIYTVPPGRSMLVTTIAPDGDAANIGACDYNIAKGAVLLSSQTTNGRSYAVNVVVNAGETVATSYGTTFNCAISGIVY